MWRRMGILWGLALALGGGRAAARTPGDSLRTLFWNVENFFDWKDDSTQVVPTEFSAYGTRHWTRKRFYTKANGIAKGLLWVAETQGGLPDIVGLAEVENRFVLRQLIQATALRKLDYGVVHYDSTDPRGIDVALLYRRSRLEVTHQRPCPVYDSSGTRLRTRDILLVQFRHKGSGRPLAVLVNHHPSKYGGAAVSERRRAAAVQRLRALTDSLLSDAGVPAVLAMGDFNDTPEQPLYQLLEGPFLNLARPLHEHGAGTIKFDGAWEMIDHFYLSRSWPGRSGTEQMVPLRIPFLMTRDTGTHGGDKPLRTYVGPRYNGGVSDHLPILLILPLPEGPGE